MGFETKTQKNQKTKVTNTNLLYIITINTFFFSPKQKRISLNRNYSVISMKIIKVRIPTKFHSIPFHEKNVNTPHSKSAAGFLILYENKEEKIKLERHSDNYG